MKRVKQETREHLNKKLNELIGTQGVTEFAKSIGLHRDDVNNWLSGKSDIRLTALIDISQTYHVSTDYLLGLSKCSSPDTSIQGASFVTGLSEEAINTLLIVRTKYPGISSKVISAPEFESLLKTFWDLNELAVVTQWETDKVKPIVDKLKTIVEKVKAKEDEVSFDGIDLFRTKKLPDLIRLLKYGKYELGDICNSILRRTCPFESIIEDAEKVIDELDDVKQNMIVREEENLSEEATEDDKEES